MEKDQINDPATTPEVNELMDNEIQQGTDAVPGDMGIDDPINSPEELQIPENWEQPIKDFINSIEDPTGRKIHFDKFKSFDDGYQKKMSELGEQRKTFESERKTFEDERAFMSGYRGFEKTIDPGDMDAIVSKFGGTPQYMNYLYQMDRMASKSPAEFIITYCKSVGIDSVDALESMLTSPQAQQMGANMSATQLKQELTREMDERLALERETARLEAQIDAFSKNPDYPYFAQVRQKMAELAQHNPNLTLEELYDHAVWTNPEIRAELQNKAMAATKQADVAAVAKAKAAIGVKPDVKTGPAKQRESWQSVLARSLN